MTAREKLREIAAWVTIPAPPEERSAAEYAAALRALAERIDAEMRAVLFMEQETRDTNDASGWGCAAAIAQSLTRLDAPLPPGTGTKGQRGGE